MHLPRLHMAAERPNFDADSQRFSYDSQLPNAAEREQLLLYRLYLYGSQ